MRPNPILSLSLAALALMPTLAAAADPLGPPLNAEQFDQRTVGRTITYSVFGQPYGSEQLKGKTYLAMFISSESDYINVAVKACAPVHFKYRGEEDIELVFITNDPANDTPEKLSTFIEQVDKNEQYDFVSDKWQYLTGDSTSIAQLRAEGFMIPSVEESAVLWLVDENGHLRGKYRPSWDFQYGTDQLKKAREDIALLKKEMDVRRHESGND